MKNNIVVNRKDDTQQLLEVKIRKEETDSYLFSQQDGEEDITLFIFEHNQQHSRLDLSLLADHLLISFDKYQKMVGITYCGNRAKGPFEVHNKQRIFLLVRRGTLDDPMGITSIAIKE
jgi:hypothetical protein